MNFSIFCHISRNVKRQKRFLSDDYLSGTSLSFRYFFVPGELETANPAIFFNNSICLHPMKINTGKSVGRPMNLILLCEIAQVWGLYYNLTCCKQHS